MWVDGTLVDTNNVKTVLSYGTLLLGYSLSADGIQKQYFSGRLMTSAFTTVHSQRPRLQRLAWSPNPPPGSCLPLAAQVCSATVGDGGQPSEMRNQLP